MVKSEGEMIKAKILDDPEKIKKVDRGNMLRFCVEAPRHYNEASRLAKAITIDYPKPQTIIVAGMGGSAIGGELLKDWARDKIAVPVEVCREYSLPEYANKNTLVFVVSYSGETEETLSVFLDAVKRKCMSVCISSGGSLKEFAEKLNVPHLRIPSEMAPRASLPYLFTPLIINLEKIGLASNVSLEVSETVKILRQVCDLNSPEKPLSDNFSKELATSICGSIPVAYGFGIYRAVAQRLKTQFNENSKVPAKWEYFPELNHNEIVGWEETNGLAKHFSLILIRDGDEPEIMRQRIEATKELLSKKSSKISEIKSVGKSQLAKMSSVICMGDFTSVYLAVVRGIDPTPVKSIALLKEKMKHSGTKKRILCELQKIADK
jgi:glucose/mannose-6-phosphate isomerase